jgi:hypothetical protein
VILISWRASLQTMVFTTPPLDRIASGRLNLGKEEIQKRVKAFLRVFRREIRSLKVVVAGDLGSFEWDFVATDASGKSVTTARM